ncbi:MAG: hypothetical protein AAF514_05765 [Verrucomicrobiota bacterium]
MKTFTLRYEQERQMWESPAKENVFDDLLDALNYFRDHFRPGDAIELEFPGGRSRMILPEAPAETMIRYP